MMTILVVDDEADMEPLLLRRFRKQLRDGAWRFLFARDGEMALERLASERGAVDLVATDIKMPRMDGLTLLSEMRKAGYDLPVVVISAFGDMANIRTAMNRGAVDFLLKPFDLNDLEATLKKVLATYQERKKTERLKENFLAHVSHELRTPLSGIIGLSDALLTQDDSAQLSSGVRKDLKLISASGRRLSRLVCDLMDFSLLQHGEMQLRCTAVSLDSLARLVLDGIRPLLRERSVSLEMDIPSLPDLWADEDRLQQILYNLIGNAVKFTQAGTITLSAEQVEGGVLLTVADSGVGLSEAQRAELQENRELAPQDRAGGLGLGLPITHQLLALHESRLEIASNTPHGSRFSFTLPLADGRAGDQSARQEPLPLLKEPAVGASMRLDEKEVEEVWKHQVDGAPQATILVVDDEPVNLRVAAHQLRHAGYRVVMAASGEEAMGIMERDSPHLVLLDLMMPGMNGFEVCRHLREIYDHAALPILVLTASHRPSDLVRALSLGANDYLVKPFFRQELLARIHAHLQVRDNERLKWEIGRRIEIEEAMRRLLSLTDKPPISSNAMDPSRSTSAQVSPKSDMRELLPHIMQLSVTLWELQDGESKISLAEQSGLWRVQLDRDTYRTRTLDKYLEPHTVPTHPRWNNVVKTAHFVLAQRKACTPAQRGALQAALDQFEALMGR
ncbi:MAG: response regulator [Magnetococcales bacterium]|nr:response regulator [Magnetococcales bacterium]